MSPDNLQPAWKIISSAQIYRFKVLGGFLPWHHQQAELIDGTLRQSFKRPGSRGGSLRRIGCRPVEWPQIQTNLSNTDNRFFGDESLPDCQITEVHLVVWFRVLAFFADELTNTAWRVGKTKPQRDSNVSKDGKSHLLSSLKNPFQDLRVTTTGI